MRAHVYVDGFNLYYGALKGTNYRWLDLRALVHELLPAGATLTQIKYFTAHVSGAADPTAPRRQHLYLKALQSLPEVEIHFGSFLAKTIWRPVLNVPIADDEVQCTPPTKLPAGTHRVASVKPQSLSVGRYPTKGTPRPKKTPRPAGDAVIAEVHTMEEKGSDVNLAAHLVNDAWRGVFDLAVVISNDTDLVTPVQMVAARGLQVMVVCPGRSAMAPKLAQVATLTRHIHASMLARAQFPEVIPGTSIQKPATW